MDGEKLKRKNNKINNIFGKYNKLNIALQNVHERYLCEENTYLLVNIGLMAIDYNHSIVSGLVGIKAIDSTWSSKFALFDVFNLH